LLLPIQGSRSHDEHNFAFIADFEFEVAAQNYRAILKDNHICYTDEEIETDNDYAIVPENRLMYLPRINNNFLLYYEVVSVSNIAVAQDEDNEEDEEVDEDNKVEQQEQVHDQSASTDIV
jgi:hypothetical protein